MKERSLAMSDEKLKILEMIQAGKLTAAEGMELLNAINESCVNIETPAVAKISSRFLKVRVDNYKIKVNVNILLSVLKASSKVINLGMFFVPEEARLEMQKKGFDFSQFDFEELVNLIDQGLIDGKLVDIQSTDYKDGATKVEVYIE